MAQLNFFLAQIERRALRIAELAVRQREEALDLVQESMLKLAEKYADKPAEQWAPLFYRILQSRIRDWYRRQCSRGRLFGVLPRLSDTERDPMLEVPDSAPDPGCRLELTEAASAIMEALLRLPLRQQQVFLLRAWEGLDVQQTADALRCGSGSVKTHYHRAIQTLRGLLQDHQ